jgi:5-methylcytosine-specific restriction endonuclease McrA
MLVLHGRLTPEVGALLRQALTAARDTLYRETLSDGPSQAQQWADALELLVESAFNHGLDPGTSGERYQVVLHVDASGQAVLADGPHVSAETSERLTCDASRTWMRHDAEGRSVEVEGRAQTIPPALRRALEHRDQGCRFPGCGTRTGQGHHIRHWAHGGPTTLSNLVVLCRRHHRAVHEEGYRVTRDLKGALRFHEPNGRPLPDVSPPALVLGDADEVIRTRNDKEGLHIDGRASRPGWLGERLDPGWAIDILRPPDNPAP